MYQSVSLQNIKMEFESGKLLVSTVARLLNYIEVSTHLSFNTLKQNNKTIIIINPKLNTPIGNRMLTLLDLTGLTFYYSSNIPPQISFMGKEIQVSQNTPDKTEKKSISIPWKQLEYPN